MKNIEALSEIAKTEPHAAYAAFIHAEQHKYTYFLRTISGISENLKSLDETINNLFIPALFGCELSDNDREIISLPIREGGLGIRKLSENANISYEASRKITRPLTTQIIKQSNSLPSAEDVWNARTVTIRHLKELEEERIAVIKHSQDANSQSFLESEVETI